MLLGADTFTNHLPAPQQQSKLNGRGLCRRDWGPVELLDLGSGNLGQVAGLRAAMRQDWENPNSVLVVLGEWEETSEEAPRALASWSWHSTVARCLECLVDLACFAPLCGLLDPGARPSSPRRRWS